MTLFRCARGAAFLATATFFCFGPVSAATPVPATVPFAVGDTFKYQYSATTTVVATKTTTTPVSYVQTTTIEPATTYNGILAFPLHTTGSYTSSTGTTTVDDVEWRNYLTSGGLWYYADYGYDDASVLVRPDGVIRRTTEKRTWGTPFFYNIFPYPPQWAEPVAFTETYDDHYETSLGNSNVLNFSETRAADGSYRETGGIADNPIPVPYTFVLNSNGTGTDSEGPAQGGTTWSFGVPQRAASGYVIPATETYAGYNHTNKVPDWYPGHAMPAHPLVTNTMYDNGQTKIPAACGKYAGTLATHLGLVYKQLDPVAGDTYNENQDYYIVPGTAHPCRLDTIVVTVYDKKVTGKVTSTTTTSSSEILLSETLVPPPPIVLSQTSLSFSALGATGAQSLTASESGYKDAFAVKSSNPAVATVSPATIQNGGKITVTPVSGGKTTIVVEDAAQQTKSVAVAVTAATLTLRDLPASMASVSIATANGSKTVQTKTNLTPKSAGCSTVKSVTACTLSAGVLPGTDTLTLQVYSGTGQTGAVLSKTSVSTAFAAGVQSVFSLSNARYLDYFKLAGPAAGSLTAGSTGDPDFYFLYEPVSPSSLSIARMSTAGAYGAYTENPSGLISLAPGKAGSGLIWFVSKAAIASLTTAGKPTLYAATYGKACKKYDVPDSVALGPDGDPWYTEALCGNYGIGTLATAKVATVTDFAFPLDANKKPVYTLSAASQHQIVTGHDGNVWFVAVSCGLKASVCVGPQQFAVGRVTPKGALSFVNLGLKPTCPSGYIAPGGDGNVWFVTCASANSKQSTVVRITPAGQTTVFNGLTTAANDIAEGADGNVYFTDQGEVARLVTGGAQLGEVDYYYPPLNVPSTNSIGVGPDGLLYVTNAGGFIDKIQPPSL